MAGCERSDIDGDARALSSRGYPVPELAGCATVEEVWLRWNESLPTLSELDSVTREVGSLRWIDAAVAPTLERLAQRDEQSSNG